MQSVEAIQRRYTSDMTWEMILALAGFVIGALVGVWLIADGLFFVERRILKERREFVEEHWPDPDDPERRVAEKLFLS